MTEDKRFSEQALVNRIKAHPPQFDIAGVPARRPAWFNAGLMRRLRSEPEPIS